MAIFYYNISKNWLFSTMLSLFLSSNFVTFIRFFTLMPKILPFNIDKESHFLFHTEITTL
jgi:hypothetical protein